MHCIGVAHVNSRVQTVCCYRVLPSHYVLQSQIEHPMDFSTVQEKLVDGDYRTYGEFLADVKLIFDNGMAFNAPGTTEHIHAKQMKDKLMDLWGRQTVRILEKKKVFEIRRLIVEERNRVINAQRSE